MGFFAASFVNWRAADVKCGPLFVLDERFDSSHEVSMENRPLVAHRFALMLTRGERQERAIPADDTPVPVGSGGHVNDVADVDGRVA